VAVVPEPSAAINGSNGGWQTVGGRRRAPPRERRPQRFSPFKELLFRKAWGKCFKCPSPDHRVATCRNLAKCLLCGESGHKARWCKGGQGEKEKEQTVGVQVSEVAVVPRESLAAARRTSSSPPVPARKKKLGGMSAPPGYAETRPALVCAAAPRTAAIAEEERKLSRLAVVAVAVGRCPDLELADVARLMARHFRLHDSEVRVTMRSVGEYLLCFDSVAA
jgi:hypothetical protein